jgi:uncharacterized protein YoxC
MSFIDQVIAAASDRGSKGTERVLLRLTSIAAAEGHKCPKPADIVAALPRTSKNEPEVEPLVFAYALYLMVEYGYEVGDARRHANNFRTELDGLMVEGNVLLTKTNITTADIERKTSLKDTAIERKIETLTNSVKSFRKMVADGRSLSDEDELAIANIVSDLQTLITTTSRVEALV